METTQTPTYVAVKTRQAYKVKATATILKAHGGTNQLLETEKKVILDDVLYEGFTSEQLAEFSARKNIEIMLAEDKSLKDIKQEDIKVSARPF